MTVTPGFNDAHLHPVGVYDEGSPTYTPWLGPEKVHNMDELIAALKAKAARTPAGQLVTGTRYQDTKLGRHPNRQGVHGTPDSDQPLFGPYYRGQLLCVAGSRH
jgi:predicted amidohydrolase YtcJ